MQSAWGPVPPAACGGRHAARGGAGGGRAGGGAAVTPRGPPAVHGVTPEGQPRPGSPRKGSRPSADQATRMPGRPGALTASAILCPQSRGGGGQGQRLGVRPAGGQGTGLAPGRTEKGPLPASAPCSDYKPDVIDVFARQTLVLGPHKWALPPLFFQENLRPVPPALRLARPGRRERAGPGTATQLALRAGGHRPGPPEPTSRRTARAPQPAPASTGT